MSAIQKFIDKFRWQDEEGAEAAQTELDAVNDLLRRAMASLIDEGWSNTEFVDELAAALEGKKT